MSLKSALKRLPPVKRYVARRAIWSRDELHAFWQQDAPEGNDPTDYLDQPDRSRMLAGFISDVPHDAAILEVGCNVGRNLAHLVDLGYTNVQGVEISAHVVEILRQSYPQLAGSDITVGPAEDVLPTFGRRQFDLVFTMAVLEHIHPDSAEVFAEIARIGKEVVAIEPGTGHMGIRFFPWDIPAEFKRQGMTLVRSVPAGEADPPAADLVSPGFVAYRFAH